MADSKKTTAVLDLDSTEFVKKLKEAMGLMGELGKTESTKDLMDSFISIGKVAGVAAAAIYAVKKSIDLVEEAEHVNQVNKSFETLAESAGLAASVIKKDLVGAARGLADDTDILQAANKAIVTMGTNAKVIPQTMEIARKATALFGGDMINNFETINRALATGQARQLRQFGIIVNNTKAEQDYAKSIGTTAANLSDAGKKQAFMNAALEQAERKFKNIDETSTLATQNMKRISVAMTELKEAAALAWESVVGPSVRKSTAAVADKIHEMTTELKAMFGHGEEQKVAIKESVEASIKQYEAKLEQDKKLGFSNDTMTEIILANKRKELEKIEEGEEAAMQADLKKMAHVKSGEGAETAPEPVDMIDLEKKKEGHLKFEKELDELRRKRTADEIENMTTVEDADRLNMERSLELKREATEKKKQIDHDFVNTGFISQQEHAQAIEAIDDDLKAKLMQNEQSLEDMRIKALDNYASHTKSVSGGIAASFKSQGMSAAKDMKNMGNQGKIIFGSLKGNATSAFKAIGDGSKTAGEAMKGFMFGAIADIAEAEGEMLLAKGIGTMDPIAIAEGGVLIALSSALRSQAGGKGGGGIGGGGGGGGGSGGGGGGGSNKIEETKPEIKMAPKKSVNLNIHGNYFETDQTRTRLMDMIRESGDFTDFNISKIGSQ